MAQSLIFSVLILMALRACSDSEPVKPVDMEGAISSGSMYYIPDDKIASIAESAEKGDNEALMKIINHYYFSYVGDDKDKITEKWQKIAADRAMSEPLRSPEEISKAIFDKNIPMDEVNKMDLGRDLRGVAVDYFRILLEKHTDCSVLKKYAENAEKANPQGAKEIDSELQSACKK